LSAYLGSINRDKRYVTPELSKNIMLSGHIVDDFEYFLYNGIHLEFFETSNRFAIYMAVLTMDLCYANFSRLKAKSAYRNLKEMLSDPKNEDKSSYFGLKSHIGDKALKDFEDSNRQEIDRCLPLIYFNFK